jgi:D-sedoheptulose 7-phosphate isomerase
MTTHPIHHVDDATATHVVADRLAGDIAAWAELAAAITAPELVASVEAAGRSVVASLRAGGCVLVAGNGGSAAIASHIAAEFVGKCILDRAPLPSVCLADSLTSITAVGNDYGYDDVFVRGVRGLGRPGDVLIAMSTSGRSRNILAALDAAAEQGIVTIALTGGTGGDLIGRADHVLVVPSADTPRIQEVHMLWAHAWCEAVDVLSQTPS